MSVEHPLGSLEGQLLGPYRLRVPPLASTSKSGWKRFELRLTDDSGEDRPPVVVGIYSAGGRGVTPWIEILDYQPRAQQGDRILDLTIDLAVELFRRLAGLLPPGGHIMLGCEGPTHVETYTALLKGVPPVATPLGFTLFRAGFPQIKFFGLPEGGWEGQQKLWAENPLDAETARRWQNATAQELRQFLGFYSPAPEMQKHVERAAAVLRTLRQHPSFTC